MTEQKDDNPQLENFDMNVRLRHRQHLPGVREQTTDQSIVAPAQKSHPPGEREQTTDQSMVAPAQKSHPQWVTPSTQSSSDNDTIMQHQLQLQ